MCVNYLGEGLAGLGRACVSWYNNTMYKNQNPMNKTKILAAISLLLVSGLLLNACNFDADSQAAQTASVKAEEAPGQIKKALKNTLDTESDEYIDLIASYTNMPDKKNLDKIEKNAKGKLKHQYKNFNALAFSIPQNELDEVLADSELEFIDLDLEVTEMLDESRIEIQANLQEEQYGFSGAGVKVEVIDSGINMDHPAFEGRIAQTIDYTGEGIFDFRGHGTNVAGIIASNDEVYKGIAPGVDLYIAKILNKYGSGRGSDLIAALDWGLENDVDVVNVSLGARLPYCGEDILSVLFEQAVANGLFIVTSNGNDGPNYGTVTSPACAEHVVGVGATYQETQMASFSSRGPTYTGIRKPDLVAPGYHIVAPYKSGFTGLIGTSQASPHVAGVAALLLEADPSLDQYELKTVLENSAKDLGFDENTQGSGLVQALAALDLIMVTPYHSIGQEYGKCISEIAKNPDLSNRQKKDGFDNCKESFRRDLLHFIPGKTK
ncbi:S8 family serine peptidase [Candidatus Peregrinibacteria bacterium]|nr:S8 family serine peptidase [Candidatus Peregrinibacteria bacterium]